VAREPDLTFKSFGDGRLKQDAAVQLYGYSHERSQNGKDVKRQYLAPEFP
jgi:hypothetical protein